MKFSFRGTSLSVKVKVKVKIKNDIFYLIFTSVKGHLKVKVKGHRISRSNKKVLLCERKRHTTRRIASARYAGICNWGVPHLR